MRIAIIAPNTTFLLPVLEALKSEKVFIYKRFCLPFLYDTIFFEFAHSWLPRYQKVFRTMRPIVRIHRYGFWEYGERIDWGRIRRVICVSSFIANQIPDSVEKIVVPNCIDIKHFRLSPRLKHDDIRVGMLGCIDPRKRQLEVLDVFKHLPSGFVLWIAGGIGPRCYMDKVLRKIREDGFQGKVRYLGYVEDTTTFLREIDVLVNNSYSEGQPMSILEAMAIGRPVLCRDWPGSEFLPADLRFSDSFDLREKLLHIEPILSRYTPNKMHEMAKKYSCTNVIPKLREAILGRR